MKERKSIIRRTPIVIFALFVCGVSITSFSFAKYASTPIEVEDSVPVANWSVSMSSEDEGNISLIGGADAQTYDFTVTNGSDTASEYTIIVSGVSNGVKVGLDDDELHATTNGTIVFTGNEALNVNSSKNHTLKFAATLDAAVVSNQGVTIDVVFAQKEPE